MKIGDLVRVDYGEERGFGPPCIFLGFSKSCSPMVQAEWVKVVDPNGRTFEPHMDYVYPVRIEKNESR